MALACGRGDTNRRHWENLPPRGGGARESMLRQDRGRVGRGHERGPNFPPLLPIMTAVLLLEMWA